MKLINKLLMGAVAAVAMCNTGCSDGTPEYTYHPSKDVDFNYCVDGDEYALDYYVVSRVKFNNTSSKTGNVVWDFGDGSTSTENNPVHKFAKAGVYRVTLTVDGVGYQTYPILIYDIKPTLSVAEQSTEVIEFGNTTMSFNLELPNPENLKVRYEWRFPEGTTYADGTPVTSFTGYADAQGNIQYPQAVKFKNIGSQKIEISTWFDVDGENRRLEDTYLNVQVGCNEPAPTLYYAQRNGNIKALKLVDTAKLPAGTKVFPYDMGVNAGSNTFNLVYADVAGEGWVYILDAGKQYYYINDENGNLGDGYINCMRPDGSGVVDVHGAECRVVGVVLGEDRFSQYYPAGFAQDFCNEVITLLTKDNSYYSALRTVYINYPFTIDQFKAINAKYNVALPTDFDATDGGSAAKSDLWFSSQEVTAANTVGYYYLTPGADGKPVATEVDKDKVTVNGKDVMYGEHKCYPVLKSAPWLFCRYSDDMGAIVTSVRDNYMPAFAELLQAITFQEWIFDSAANVYKVEFSRKYSLESQFRVYDTDGEEGIAADVREISIN